MQSFLKFNPAKIVLLTIILTAIALRLYGLDWDQGSHLHPDERAIVMFTTALEWPKNINEFFSPNSSWNPHFFAYGSFPIYLLKIAGDIGSIFNPTLGQYDGINLIGRFISALFDMGTLYVVFLIGKKLFNTKVGLLGAFFYGISVLPIQLSHFYAVDTPLTFFVMLTLWWLIHLYEKPSKKHAILAGIFFGLALATKVSAVVLFVSIGTATVIDFLFIFLKNPHRPHSWLPHVPIFIKRLITDGVIIFITTIIVFAVVEPYAFIDFQTFLLHNMQQRQMTYDPFTFPYTLQYVGKIPYLYELKNIFFWGQGPILAILSFLGTLYVSYKTMKQWNSPSASLRAGRTMIILIFFFTYFLVVGKFAVGWIRYMLPLYPLLALFAALFALRLYVLIKDKLKMPAPLFMILNSLFIIFVLAWPLSFIHIYAQPNTRVLASQWINKNIPPNSIIAREHWDDGLPIGGNVPYKILELPIYEIADPIKKTQIYKTVQEANYIIIASNRLYVPLQRLAQNCQKWNLQEERCAKNANKYYEKLFSGDMGYKKVAEFENPPTIPLFNIIINDQNADESFTVYDHPKVIIFKNEKIY